jgi:hypothetical protein
MKIKKTKPRTISNMKEYGVRKRRRGRKQRRKREKRGNGIRSKREEGKPKGLQLSRIKRNPLV